VSRIARAALAALPSIVVCRPALAHMIGDARGFPGGVLHPLLVPAHALALIAMGLMLGSQDRAAALRLFAVFVLSLATAVAMVAAAYAPREPAMILLIATACAALAAAIGRPLPMPFAAILAGVAAIALLLDSVPAVVSTTETLLALAGTIFSASAVLLIVSTLAMTARRHWQRIAVRIAGSWCAASALLVLALQMAR
jgi:urease accessory protein